MRMHALLNDIGRALYNCDGGIIADNAMCEETYTLVS